MRADAICMADGGAQLDAARVAARDNNLEFVDLERYNIDPGASSVLPADVAAKNRVLPIGRKFGAPVVAVADPGDLLAIDTVRAVIGREFIVVVADAEQIASFASRVYRGGSASGSEPASDSASGSEPASDTASGSGPASDTASGSGPASDTASGSGTVTGSSPRPGEATREPASLRGRGGGTLVADVITKVETARVTAPPPPASAPIAARLSPAARLTPPAVSAPAAPAPAVSAPAAPATSVSAPAAPATSVVLDKPVASATVLATAPAPTTVVEIPAPDAVDVVDQLDVDQLRVESSLAQGAVAAPPAPAQGSAETAGFPPLARVLVEGGRVSLVEMKAVLAEHARTGEGVARILSARELVTEGDLMWGMAQEMGLDFIDLDLQVADFTAAYLLPEATSRYHHVLVVGHEDGVPVVATSNPTDVFAVDDLRTLLGRKFKPVVATRAQIATNIDRAYSDGGNATEVAQTAASDFNDANRAELGDLHAVEDDAPIVRYVNLLVLQALNERASDIHVEPTEECLRIRYRIDGVLHDASTAPRAIAPAVTTRLKVMADLNIAEHRIPQDGRISLMAGNRQVDLRVATLPTIYGEKVVMRVLDKSNVVLGFEDLGFEDDLLEEYRLVYTKPYGTILVTGPTGSGKTTTLYATLSALNAPDRNIITVEDPVELRIKGINQVQLNTKAGLTFASALRSILRSDPDIVLVGEIRDRETALISVEAALTGHLVLATLHTNDSASTPMRLIEMGLEPYLVTSAVTAAVAQRLARQLCSRCKTPFEATEADILAAGWKPEEVFADNPNPVLYRAAGCPACSKTGYRGRKALVELLVLSEEIERLIIEGGSADDIHRLAVEQGMVTLRRRGLHKALSGETTLEEVLRVVA